MGLPDGDHQPGSEFSVLLIACLLAILWAHLRKAESQVPGDDAPSSRSALEFVRIASASILIVHPIGGLREPAGLNDLGLYFSSIGFPFGVQLVWGSMFLQITSSLALIARPFVVPAASGKCSFWSRGYGSFMLLTGSSSGRITLWDPAKKV